MIDSSRMIVIAAVDAIIDRGAATATPGVGDRPAGGRAEARWQ